MIGQQLSTQSTVMVTNCTARKRGGGTPVSMPANAPTTSLQALVGAWVGATRSVAERVEAQHLYLGRSFGDALRASRVAGASLRVVSAGFGLLAAADRVPNYNLTVSTGTGSIRSVIGASGATPASWWCELNAALGASNPVATLAARPDIGKVLLAMPSSYLNLVREDLMTLPRHSTERLWIFTSRAGRIALPEHLQCRVLPYDARLESVAGHAGTATDFPQRALRHFVEVVGGHRMTFDQAKAAIEQALGSQRARLAVPRAKLSDADIRVLLRSQWQSKGGSSTRLLRFLRDDAKVACEQRRFRDIWRSMLATETA